jgi:hypothetical protein
MRAKRPLGVLLALLIVGLLQASIVLAMHHPQVTDVTAEAVALGMSCNPDVGQVICTGFGPNQTYRTATVTPGSGPLDALQTTVPAFLTRANGYVMDANDQSWNTTMHNVGCDDAAAVAAFMAKVAALNVLDTSTGSTTLSECALSGTLSSGSIDFSPMYVVTSRTLPAAFATPTPTPSPTATPAPTATPKATPAPTATAKPTATAGATATATTSPTAAPLTSESLSVSASPSASASESPSASQAVSTAPIETPEQSVAGITFTPEPTVPAGAPDEGVGGWPGSVPSAGRVSTNLADIGGSLLAALLLLVAMGFIGELFNNTMEANHDRMIGWWKESWVGRIGRDLGGFFGGGST